MNGREQIAGRALNAALQIRQKARVPLTDALCVFDFAEANGISEVRFTDIPSLEEIYWRDARRIFISSLRPAGRQSFNCAHGFGHHVFGHSICIAGTAPDDLTDRKYDRNEFLVDCFAGFLLMPRSAVSHGFVSRGWQPVDCTPSQAYTVTGWLGVGYTSLLQHASGVLKLMSCDHARVLAGVKLKQIRSELVGRDVSGNVVIVDAMWTGRPVDIEVGDLVVLPPGVMFSGDCIAPVEEDASRTLLRGAAPGADGHVVGDGWGVFVRVSRRGFYGRNLFRHLEDPDHVND